MTPTMTSLSDKLIFISLLTSKVFQIVPKILLHIYTNKINGHAFQETRLQKVQRSQGIYPIFARREFVKDFINETFEKRFQGSLP